ncbi:MAG: MBL fold metallo-hydrolase [Pirellulales bacterium]|nr:MBL fold metallo-hydrolase [Pirellulales bacterium]
MTSQNTVGECYFLDVGQGSSNVILLGGGRGIVIDCSSQAHVPLKLLKRYVDRIIALVVSHNDHDHHGGSAGIVAAYPRAIDHLYFLQDRPVEQIGLYAVVQDALNRGLMVNPPIRLERQEGPRILYEDPTTDLSLELLFPTFLDNLEAQDAASPNATSGVLALLCGNRKIVFSGDSTLGNWQLIQRRLGSPVSCDVLTVPHHGGNVVTTRQKNESPQQHEIRTASELDWLYTKAVHCKHAVISVGTSNQHRHPNTLTVAALRRSGASVLCTQITHQCHDDLESLRPGVIQPPVPSRSTRLQDLTRSGRSRNVACTGTVICEVGPTQLTIRQSHAHQQAVDRMAGRADAHPLCR